MDWNTELLAFIRRSPTAFHAAKNSATALAQAGFTPLNEDGDWHLEAGHGYYVGRGGTALAAFRLPQTTKTPLSFQISAAHGDSPCLKLKPTAIEKAPQNGYLCLESEPYGGGLWGTWADRPLGLAGQVLVRQPDGTVLPRLVEPAVSLMLPSLPIHMNRNANDGVKIDLQADLRPTLSLNTTLSLRRLVAEALAIDPKEILSQELCVFCRSEGLLWGAEQEFISSPRLDDLQCVFSTLQGFLQAQNSGSIGVWLLLDHEEIGSQSSRGAAGTFLSDTLERICLALNQSRAEQLRAYSASFLLSADNAHALHPAHIELYDPVNRVAMNKGIVLKHATAYSTNGFSDAVFRALCEQQEIPIQDFANRSNIRGGSTLANIAATQLSIPMADIGLAQLAMHGAFETAGAQDTAYMIQAMTAFFSRTLVYTPAGGFLWK